MLPDAVKVSAEDGRRAEAVDISPFINNLPGGSSTTAFRSDDASGSTSQAANIQVGVRGCVAPRHCSLEGFGVLHAYRQS
jgi:predicted ABC-class ATPase